VPGHLTGKTVAITGSAGFIGGRLVERLAGDACTIVRVARATAPPLVNPAASVIDVVGDVSHRDVWDCIVDADVIVHLAAQTSNAVAAADPDLDFCANVTPMRHLLAACRERRRRPLVLFGGTATEAGVQRRMQLNEDAPDNPITIYDKHKLMAEQELKAAAANGDVRGATLRLANVYGPGARGQRVDRDVLNRMIKTAIDGGSLTVHGTGEYVRDYVFVEDVVDAFLMAGAQPDRVTGRHFVIGSGSGISIRDAFELIAARVGLITGRRVPVTMSDPGTTLSAIEQRHFVADPSRFSAATGWRPSWSLSDGIDRTIEAFRCA
jgi:UDP-glucose 4-epimerase